jgi:hypothetical protein
MEIQAVAKIQYPIKSHNILANSGPIVFKPVKGVIWALR